MEGFKGFHSFFPRKGPQRKVGFRLGKAYWKLEIWVGKGRLNFQGLKGWEEGIGGRRIFKKPIKKLLKLNQVASGRFGVTPAYLRFC